MPGCDPVTPTATLDELAQAVTADVPAELRNAARDFYRHVLFEVVQASHGTLVAVLPKARGSSQPLRGRPAAARALDTIAPIASFLAGSETEAVTVRSMAQLLRGMMATDGITVLRSDGCIVGYNVFVRHPETLSRTPAAVGGARRRTFDVLCGSVGARPGGGLLPLPGRRHGLPPRLSPPGGQPTSGWGKGAGSRCPAFIAAARIRVTSKT